MSSIIVVVVFILLVALSLFSTVKRFVSGKTCCGGGSSTVSIEPSDKDKSHYSSCVSFEISGMKCKGCVETITNALNSIDGVYAEKVSLKNKKATVLLKDYVVMETICSSLTKLGYCINLC